MKLVIDCDNTFGVHGCDIDDGLAILYALGTEGCELLGVTTTFGNNTLEVVYPNTQRFMKAIGRSDIPVLCGAEADAHENKAAEFLVEQANRYPGLLSVLAIGSLTNLYHAWRLDQNFFKKLQKLSFMGGITEPLIINGVTLEELNFSCNAEASFHVLSEGESILIATGNNCLDAFFSWEGFDRLKDSEYPFLQWLHQEGRYWFDREREVFSNEGIYKWDVFAVSALLNPQCFHPNPTMIQPSAEALKDGMLFSNDAEKPVELPRVIDISAYEAHVYKTYENFAATLKNDKGK